MPTKTVRAETMEAFTALEASRRSPEIPEAQDVYGWLVGSWDLEVLCYAGVDVTQLGIHGEAHFAWALEGRAVQDVWIMPKRHERSTNTSTNNNMYGTTLRVWDPSIAAWRITWINPVRCYYEQQTGRRIGSDIVQTGARPNGTATRWRFTEITPNSFLWVGDMLESDGSTWKLEGKFRAHKMP